MAKERTTQQSPKVGDPVLWYGFRLKVTKVGDGKVDVANTDAPEIVAARDEIMRLRESQTELTGAEHAAVHDQITKLSKAASKVIVRAGLRTDLLNWWEDVGAWVSDGRILSDGQVEAWQKATGSREKPADQRSARQLLERMELLRDPTPTFTPTAEG